MALNKLHAHVRLRLHVGDQDVQPAKWLSEERGVNQTAYMRGRGA